MNFECKKRGLTALSRFLSVGLTTHPRPERWGNFHGSAGDLSKVGNTGVYRHYLYLSGVLRRLEIWGQLVRKLPFGRPLPGFIYHLLPRILTTCQKS